MSPVGPALGRTPCLGCAILIECCLLRTPSHRSFVLTGADGWLKGKYPIQDAARDRIVGPSSRISGARPVCESASPLVQPRRRARWPSRDGERQERGNAEVCASSRLRDLDEVLNAARVNSCEGCSGERQSVDKRIKGKYQAAARGWRSNKGTWCGFETAFGI